MTGSHADLVNSVFVRNVAGNSAWAAGAFQATMTMMNCTVYENEAIAGGGVRGWNSPQLTVVNTILWGNLPDQTNLTDRITYSIVEGGQAGPGNTGAEPHFLAPNGSIQSLDLRLGPCSPAIDRGNDAVAPLTDMAGNSRLGIASVPNCDRAGTEDCSWISNIGALEYTSAAESCSSICRAPGDCSPGAPTEPDVPD